MDHLTEDTRALLRAAREIHAEHHGAQTFTQGTHLPLEEAGRRIGINPARLRYYDAIKKLEYEGGHRVGRECAIRHRTEPLRHHRAGHEDAAGTRLEARAPRSPDLSPDEVTPVTGLPRAGGASAALDYTDARRVRQGADRLPIAAPATHEVWGRETSAGISARQRR